MRIGALAAATGTPVETVRYYEREGLLQAPARADNNYRVYTGAHADRLAFIRHCRHLDMTLDEIRTLLRFKDRPQQNCDEVDALLDAHIGHVAARIRELRTLQADLKQLRARCGSASGADECGILSGLDHAVAGGAKGTASRHIRGTH